jgi:hypothetical protein
MKKKITFKLFKEILLSHKRSIVLAWLFYFLLSNFGSTPYKTWWLLIISGAFSLILHIFISLAILIFKKEEI